MNANPALIAIVDDEEPVRRAMQRLFRAAGLKVEAFEGGAEFLTSLQTHQPDCVILDLHMPGMSGFDVQERLCAARVRVPVIVITGHDMPEARERALAAGAAAYFRKPVDGQALLDAIITATTHARP